MLKIVLGFIVSVLLFPAFGQSIHSITFRVEDKIGGRVSFERHEFDRERKRFTSFDSLTNHPIMSAAEYNDGRTTVITTPDTRATVESSRSPETLRPGEEIFGTVVIESRDTPTARLAMHTKATKQGDLTVLETVSAGNGYVTLGRVAYATDYRRPVWRENITHINGRKVQHDYLVAVQ
ncbi:MAG: hypothetical protein ACAH17_00510 [Candidatus Paceibacterota bacterium]